MRGVRAAVAVAALVAVAACGGDDVADLTGDADDAASEAAADIESDDVSDVGTDEAADGGEAPDDDAPDDDAPDADASNDEGLDDEVQEMVDGLDFGDGAARVTIGDTTYEFALGGNSTVGSTTYLGICQQLFGMMAGAGYDSGGRAITVDFEILPDDWESYDDGRFDSTSNRLEVEDEETGVAWAADESLAELYPETAGSSQIDEWISDGSRASGTATFIPLESWSAPVEGASPVTGSFELGCADD